MNKRIKIKQFLVNNLNTMDLEFELSDTDNIFELGLINSLFALQLIGFVEKEFAIRLSDEDINIMNFTSVESISRLLTKYDVAEKSAN